MRILTNFERFPEAWTAASGVSGQSRYARTFEDFRNGLSDADVILINCDVGLTLRLCALFTTRPWVRKPLIAADLVFRIPKNRRARLLLPVKRFLLRQVTLFINYFRDLRGYAEWYGAGPERSAYVPFKVNVRYRFDTTAGETGRYVLCLGRSMRDYDTFFAAMERLPYPAAIPAPDFAQLSQHESRFTRSLQDLPKNVEVLTDAGGDAAMLAMIRNAKVVALPVLKSSLCASGVSTYLNAMLLRKCVILTEGPGASDVLTDQAIVCASEDPVALAVAIRRAWEDDALRESTAARGYEYAHALGGEPELFQRIIDVVPERLRKA